ncbi:Dph6-related ATP pyrophosphatase [Sediminitomix flava]|uniref:Uncharacterized protein (TIGR00290 family) n=1 Tax=Sediminitomix flava TaxID=379075 RepID=A0A315ZBX7_SEDFL|nr:diphthine--ammonia ligase [Sediminitomix flava]PWJ43041.1 uncharacterized protein (TIGR00290 family) [Sediminitomix flava]
MIKSIFNWSGGKDSALALHYILEEKKYDVQALMTTVSDKYDRISMHGVRTSILRAQGEAIGLPIKEIRLPEMSSMEVYDNTMKEVMTELQKEGVTHSIFGDIFLEDLKAYRDEKLAQTGMTGHYPLWKRDTTELVHEFIDLGFKTVVACINSELLDKEFAGRVIDKDFLKDLPKNVDPCGENGEFHTCIVDGPIFKNPLKYELGDVTFREYKAPEKEDDAGYSSHDKSHPKNDKKSGFYFCDIIPVE